MLTDVSEIALYRPRDFPDMKCLLLYNNTDGSSGGWMSSFLNSLPSQEPTGGEALLFPKERK